MNPEPLITNKSIGILGKDDLVELILWAVKAGDNLPESEGAPLRFLIRRVLPILNEADKLAIAAAIVNDSPSWIILRKDILDA